MFFFILQSYRIVRNFRGREFSRTLQIKGLSRTFSSRKLGTVGVVIGLSAIRKKLFAKSYLEAMGENFLPRKFPAIRYANNGYVGPTIYHDGVTRTAI